MKAVGLVIENAKGEVLVLKRHPEKPEGSLWGLPGGKIDAGEDAQTAVIREVYEETGLRVNPGEVTLLKSYHWQWDELDLYFTTFTLRIVSDSTIMINSAEHTESMWAKPIVLHGRDDLMRGLYEILEDMAK